MNEQLNVLGSVLTALSQLQNVKDKLDPEVLELLNKSAHEAISSAHTFLDACEKAIDSLASSEESGSNEGEVEQNEPNLENIVNLSSKNS